MTRIFHTTINIENDIVVSLTKKLTKNVPNCSDFVFIIGLFRKLPCPISSSLVGGRGVMHGDLCYILTRWGSYDWDPHKTYRPGATLRALLTCRDFYLIRWRFILVALPLPPLANHV